MFAAWVHEQRRSSACTIQHTWRVYVALQEWKERLQAAARQHKQLERMELLQHEKETQGQVVIAKGMRGWLQHRKYVVLVEMTRACLIVQRSYRCRLATNNLMARIVNYNKRKHASTTIQCVGRCYLSKKQYFLLQRIQLAEIHIASVVQRAEEFEYLFTLLGSACVVQIWWRSCVLMLQAKYRVKAIKFRAAMYIECWWRGWHARRGVIQRKLAKRIKRREVEHAAACKIQQMCCLARSRQRMKKIRAR